MYWTNCARPSCSRAEFRLGGCRCDLWWYRGIHFKWRLFICDARWHRSRSGCRICSSCRRPSRRFCEQFWPEPSRAGYWSGYDRPGSKPESWHGIQSRHRRNGG
jgi:hypothetical protein